MTFQPYLSKTKPTNSETRAKSQPPCPSEIAFTKSPISLFQKPQLPNIHHCPYKSHIESHENSKENRHIHENHDEKFAFCSSINMKTQKNEGSDRLPMIISNSRFFKINPKIISMNYEEQKTKRRHKGKSVHSHELVQLSGKDAFLTKLEFHHSYISSTTSSPTNLNVYVKDYLMKVSKPKPIEKNSVMALEKKRLNVSDEDLVGLFGKFHDKKLIKSKCLMKYFQGKSSELILIKMAKCLHSLVFSCVENNRASFELIENIHRNLEISQSDFYVFKGLLLMTMRENGVNEKDVQILSEAFEKFRVFIIKKPEFDEICPNKQLGIEDFLTHLHQNIRENGILDRIFGQLDEEKAIFHHKRLFSMICDGYRGLNKELNLRDTHHRLGVSWRDCYELKNAIMNVILDKKSLTFSEEFVNFYQNLQNLHKFMLSEPNLYCPSFENLNFQFINDLLMNSIQKEPGLNKIFFGLSNEKFENHCKYIINFIMKSPQNPYIINDLIPAHCMSFISDKEFLCLYEVLAQVLAQIKLKKEENVHLLMNFQRCRGVISREKSLLEKIGGVETIDAFVEAIYVYIFGSPETKQFFLNSNIEYVKFKEKMFFARMMKDEIDGVDLVDLKAIHEKMGIKQKNYDAFMKFAGESLINLKLKPGFINMILDKINFLRPFICCD